MLLATGRTAEHRGARLEQPGVEDHAARDRDRRPAARRGKRLGDRRLHGRRTVHARRQVPGARRGGGRRRPLARADYRAIPAVAFTDPQIAAVGTTEGEGLSPPAGSWTRRRGLHLRAAEAPRLREGRRRPEAARPGRRGRGRARVGRVAPAAHARDPGRGPRRRPAGRDPALPHLFRGRLLGAAGVASSDAIERIVVASDRSETATRAVAWAAEMARRYEAQLTVVQVFVPGPPPPGAETELAVYAEEIAGSGTRARVDAGEDPARRDRRRRRGGGGGRARRREHRDERPPRVPARQRPQPCLPQRALYRRDRQHGRGAEERRLPWRRK